MKEKIVQYFNQLFEKAPDTVKALELKKEMTQNALDKFEDLLQDGYPEEEAYQNVVSSIGDVTELFGELEEKTLFTLSEKDRKKKALLHAMGTGSVSLLQEQQFDISTIEKLTVSYEKNSQDVFLYEGEGNTIVVREYANYAVEEAALSQINLSGSTLTVQGIREKGSWVSLNRYRYTEILLPADYAGAMEIATASGEIGIDRELALKKELKLSSTSGDITVGKTAASEIRISSASGEVRTGGLTAEKLRIGTNSGDIHVTGAEGQFSISSASGTVMLDEGSGCGGVETTSGDIRLSFAALTGELTVDSTSGEVVIKLPEATALDFSAATVSGEISTFFDELLSFSKKGDRASGSVGSGDHALKITTTSGDIRIKKN